MRVLPGPSDPRATDAAAVAVGVWAGGPPVCELAPGAGRTLATRVDGRWRIAVGLGRRDEWDAERAREAGARAVARAEELDVRTLAWDPPTPGDAGPLVEGAVLRAWRYDKPALLDELVVCGAEEAVLARAAAGAGAQNRARRLQDAPPNEMTPGALAARARELPGVEVEVLDPSGEGCAALAAVARGSDEPPALIVLRYDGGGLGPLTGWIGKAVTFDSGGYSLKTATGMRDQKWDMTGGAVVLEAIGAVAALGLPVRLLGVIGATENLVSGRALKPGDVIHARDGTSIEVTNTDAEGRLVLADCLHWARDHGAERLLDVATLTGGVVTALGDQYAAIMGNDQTWIDAVRAAGDAAGEATWPLPIHPDFRSWLRGRVSDVVNSPPHRKAHASVAATFLERFAGEVPWAHLDIAGVADDNGRAYTPKGAAGWGVRLLIALAART